jgi:hypothetical protein
VTHIYIVSIEVILKGLTLVRVDIGIGPIDSYITAITIPAQWIACSYHFEVFISATQLPRTSQLKMPIERQAKPVAKSK